MEKALRRGGSWHVASSSRRGLPVRRIRVKRPALSSSPTVPRLPQAGPAVLPKPLKPVPPPPASPASGAGGASTTARRYAWLRLNGPILVLNFGSLCTLGGFTRTDVLELRIGNVIGNLCGMTYFALNRLWPPLTWASVFGFANAYNIYLILVERSDRVILSRDEQAIYEEHFLPHGLTPMQFSRLMESSKTVLVPKGHVIVQRGGPLDSVSLVIRGRTRASVLGRRLTYASSLPGNYLRQKGGDSGAWVGEIAFLESFWKKEQLQRTKTRRFAKDGGMSTPNNRKGFDEQRSTEGGKALHTILAEDDCELRCWSHKKMEEVMKTSADMRAAMTRSMTAAVVGKVVNFTVSKSQKATQEQPTWSTWLEEGKQSGHVTVTREDTGSDDKDVRSGSGTDTTATAQGAHYETGDVLGNEARATVTRQDAIAAFREVLLNC